MSACRAPKTIRSSSKCLTVWKATTRTIQRYDPLTKEPKYAFKLYLTFGKIDEASKIAIAMVKSEAEEGKYKEAHKLLVSMLTEILERKAKISFELVQKIVLIHSQTLVRNL